MDKSKISWTHATWNFVVGCSKVSPGCEHCYAERLALRYGWSKKPWTAPNASKNVVIKDNKLELPLTWKTPRRIFVNSLSDLFHEQVPDVIIRTAFGVMGMCPQHTFQILTKRPARMKAFIDSLVAEMDFFSDHWSGRGECTNHFPNVWLGVSVEDQRRANERIPLLLQTPAAIRFLSCEPLLGQVHLFEWLSPCSYYCDHSEEYLNAPQHQDLEGWEIWFGGHHPARSRIDWVIVVGERDRKSVV